MKNKTTYYSDLNLAFEPHPLTGDVTTTTNENAVKRSLMHIGHMISYDIPFEPELHGHIQELLFDIPSDTTRLALASRLKWAINKLEPRANIKEIKVTLDHQENAYFVEVLFTVLSLLQEYSTGFYLERVR